VASKAPFFDDLGLVLQLLEGRLVVKKGRPTVEYLSPSTKPTSQEAQEALARLLAAFAKKLTKGPIRNNELRGHLATILASLAQLFDAHAPLDANLRLILGVHEPALKVGKITRLSKGHTNPLDYLIALEVEQLIKSDQPKLKAYRTVARKYRIGQRRVEEICGDDKKRDRMKPDGRSDLMK
jgi:hypothetical protein